MFRFTMSGRVFSIDPAAKPSLLDLAAFAETGVDPATAGELLVDVAAARRPFDVQAARTVGALAYIAALRAGSDESWRQFARSMDPATLQFLPPEESEPAPPAEPEPVAEPGEQVDPHPLFTQLAARQT